MTSAEFAAKYNLLKPLTTQGVRTFIAQDRALKRMVLAHFLEGGPTPENKRVMWLIGRLPETEHAKVLEMDSVDGRSLIVTQYTPLL